MNTSSFQRNIPACVLYRGSAPPPPLSTPPHKQVASRACSGLERQNSGNVNIGDIFVSVVGQHGKQGFLDGHKGEAQSSTGPPNYSTLETDANPPSSVSLTMQSTNVHDKLNVAPNLLKICGYSDENRSSSSSHVDRDRARALSEPIRFVAASSSCDDTNVHIYPRISKACYSAELKNAGLGF